MNTLTAPPKAGHFVRGSSDEAMTVCVLDDESSMVEMLQESLRCLGFSSIGTCDPQHALELIDEGRVKSRDFARFGGRLGRIGSAGDFPAE